MDDKNLYQICHEINLEFAEKTPSEYAAKGFKKIAEPAAGSILYYMEDAEQTPKRVKVLGGQYLSNGRVSNWWDWVELDENNKAVSGVVSGYGRFYDKSIASQ